MKDELNTSFHLINYVHSSMLLAYTRYGVSHVGEDTNILTRERSKPIRIKQFPITPYAQTNYA